MLHVISIWFINLFLFGRYFIYRLEIRESSVWFQNEITSCVFIRISSKKYRSNRSKPIYSIPSFIRIYLSILISVITSNFSSHISSPIQTIFHPQPLLHSICILRHLFMTQRTESTPTGVDCNSSTVTCTSLSRTSRLYFSVSFFAFLVASCFLTLRVHSRYHSSLLLVTYIHTPLRHLASRRLSTIGFGSKPNRSLPSSSPQYPFHIHDHRHRQTRCTPTGGTTRSCLPCC
jgi:hypothetical protein